MKSIYIETYGCSANRADSEIIAGILKNSGFAASRIPHPANLIIINTCFVKTPTENRINARLREIQKKFPKKKLIVAGCYPEAAKKLIEKFAPNASLCGPRKINLIAEIAEKTLKGEKIVALGHEKISKAELPKARLNPMVEIIEVSDGCLSNCTFCATKLARGNLNSFPIGQVARNVEKAVKAGCKEIWLTSQDMAAYGLDFGRNLPDLLKEICKIEGNFRIRVGMANPSHVIRFTEELIEIYKSEKIYKFLHLPVQSGSNEILRLMGRGGTVGQFKEIVQKFRKEIPELALNTDIIVGFPTETEKQFKETLKLISEIKPDFVNISRYGARPGTKAARMPQISDKISKERSEKISELVKKIGLEQNKKWIGWHGAVLISEKGKIKGSFVARNFAYKPIVVKSTKNLLGKIAKAEIIGATPLTLTGKII